MKPKNLLRDYITRLVHQTLVQVTGGLGFVLTAAMELLFPGVLIKWLAYLVLLLAGLIVGGYQVFAELLEEQEKERADLILAVRNLENKLNEFENRQPLIVFGFQDESGQLKQRLKIKLEKLPSEPSFDIAIEKKRSELLAKKEKALREHSSTAKGIAESLFKVNPKFDQEVEKYLVRFRKYLIHKHEQEIISDRTKWVKFVTENRGLYPANNVTIELRMPRTFSYPKEELSLKIWLSTQSDSEYKLEPPDEPELLLNTFKINIPNYLPDSTLYDVPNSIFEMVSNTRGPEIVEREGFNYATYHIKKLIQNRPETDLSSLLLWLRDISQSTTWEIDINIYAEELFHPIKQKIWIDFNFD
jgi:hypothetical protein